MKNAVIWTLLKEVYAKLIRPILFKAIDDPNVQWDDWLMKFVDNIFEYDGS